MFFWFAALMTVSVGPLPSHLPWNAYTSTRNADT